MTVAACPGCAVGELAADYVRPDAVTHHLVLPGIHCAACIQGVESVLNGYPGIGAARVNLTKKRVAISALPGDDPTPWIIALSKAGYEAYEADAAAADPERDLLMPLGVAGFAMMNVMLLSVAVWSGATETTRDFLHWVTAAIALPATTFAAQPFFRNAAFALRAGRLNMDVPISLAIILACGMSLYEVSQGGAHAWFDAALALTFFLLVGRALDQRLRRAARSAADNLSALEPSRALRIEGDIKVNRPVTEIAVNDRLWLNAGARVPVDGRLEAGQVAVDASFLTGESALVTRHAGQMLYAGEVVMTGPLTLQAVVVGEDTKLRRIAQMVATAEGARGRFRSLADRAAAIYTPAVHIISAVAFLGWLFATGDARMAINVAIATLIITCPCALGLAVPAMGVAATSALFRNGVLVTSETALERVAAIDTVVFDKTGTLTERRLTVPDDVPAGHLPVLRALADASDHPLSRGLVQTLRDVPAAKLAQVHEDVGRGIFAVVDGIQVSLGREDSAGGATCFAFGDNRYPLPSEEILLPDAAASVAGLRKIGVKVHMLTGDNHAAAARIAAELGIDVFAAEVQPEDKADYVAKLQEAGATVLMVGDGLNDTAALTSADASLAPGSALEASRNAADMILVSGQLMDVPRSVIICQTARRRILQNFGLAVTYNSISVPIAVLGFATPLSAAIAMSTSSICVIVNSLRKIRL
ncbi:MAG: heavy metal translocating P-type ATPase [Pseudomonadota bacterium]